MSPPDSGLSCASSLPTSTTSPTMTDVFGLPTPPLSLGTGRSRSPSPLTLIQAASNKPFATKPVLMWNKQDVADWLESLNLGEHRDAFMDNDIEGSHLPNLQKEDLIDLGVTRVGHRMNIERALKVLLDRWDWADVLTRTPRILFISFFFPLHLFGSLIWTVCCPIMLSVDFRNSHILKKLKRSKYPRKHKRFPAFLFPELRHQRGHWSQNTVWRLQTWADYPSAFKDFGLLWMHWNQQSWGSIFYLC